MNHSIGRSARTCSVLHMHKADSVWKLSTSWPQRTRLRKRYWSPWIVTVCYQLETHDAYVNSIGALSGKVGSMAREKYADHHVVDCYTCVQTSMTVSHLWRAKNVMTSA
jgi:hypothetical protein